MLPYPQFLQYTSPPTLRSRSDHNHSKSQIGFFNNSLLIQTQRIHPSPLYPQHLRIQQPLVPALSPPHHPHRVLGEHPLHRTPLVIPRPLAPKQRSRPNNLRLCRPRPVARDLPRPGQTPIPQVLRPRTRQYLVQRAGGETSQVPRATPRHKVTTTRPRKELQSQRQTTPTKLYL